MVCRVLSVCSLSLHTYVFTCIYICVCMYSCFYNWEVHYHGHEHRHMFKLSGGRPVDFLYSKIATHVWRTLPWSDYDYAYLIEQLSLHATYIGLKPSNRDFGLLAFLWASFFHLVLLGVLKLIHADCWCAMAKQ